jgi:3-hydroxyisobutyrate dehydrogenase-like beta-hydroxyacid dehydrogenase
VNFKKDMNKSNENELRIGLVGLGQMGSAMGRRLLKVGKQITVYNRSPGPIDEFVSLGANRARDLKSLAESSDLIFTVLSDTADVEEVILGNKGLLTGSHTGTLIVECSTIDPHVSLRIGDIVRKSGFRMLDAPIGGRPNQAEEGKLVFMVGALSDDLELARTSLLKLSSKIVHCGGPSMGIAMKVVNNLLGQSIQVMDLEAISLGIKAGLDPKTMLDVLTSTAADNVALHTKIPQSILNGKYLPGFSIKNAHKDQGLAHTMASRLGVPLFTLGQARHLYSIAMTKGLEDKPNETIAKIIEQLSGIEIRYSN